MTLHRRDFLVAAAATLAQGAESPRRPRSPFLEGNYAPVREEIAADNLRVIGKLPADLEGMFLRNGPNPQFAPKGLYHWFDGDGMIHGVRLQGGKASYRNRYVRTAGWKEENKAGKALYGGLLDPVDFGKILAGKPTHKNTANTAPIWYHGRLLALWEGGEPHALEVPDLDVIEPYTFGGGLRHACTAHPKIDPATGEFLFFGYKVTRPYVQYSVADATGVIRRTTPIDLPRPIMMHDFAVTPRYTLFLDLPEVFSLDALRTGKPPFRYEPKYGSRVGILPRHGQASDLRWFPIDTCFVFHTLNAYEEGDEVVLQACRMKDFPPELDPPDRLSDQKLSSYGGVLYRWRFHLKSGKVREQALDDVPSDFPRLDDARLARKARYGYTMRLKMDGLIKYDLEKGSTETHFFGKDRLGGEAVFVPRPGGRHEDDGWLVTYVFDAPSNKSEMVVIEARDFRAAPVARVQLPARVPFGFHGTWLPEETLRNRTGKKPGG